MEQWIQDNLRWLARNQGLWRTVNGIGDVNQSAMEDKTKVAQTTISGILKQGKMPRADTLEKLAHGLGVEMWQLAAPPELFRASQLPKFKQFIRYMNED